MTRLPFIVLSFLCSLGFSQIHDACQWTSAAIKADLTNKFSVTYGMENRLYKNLTSLDSYINEISFGYEPVKNVILGVDYRYSRKNQEGYFEGVHRFGAEASYDYKLDGAGLRFKARVRYQIPFNYLGVINDAIYPDNRNVMRFKLGVKYTPVNLKKIQPFGSFEIYKAISPKNIYNSIDSYRLTFGVSFDLPKRHGVDLFYMLEKENRAAQFYNHIWGVQYSYEIFKDPIFQKEESK